MSASKRENGHRMSVGSHYDDVPECLYCGAGCLSRSCPGGGREHPVTCGRCFSRTTWDVTGRCGVCRNGEPDESDRAVVRR